MNFSEKNIFLIDGVGALLTAVLLSQVLGKFETFFGMPTATLYVLALIALAFSIYSFLGQFVFKNHFPTLLKGIIVANILYCVLTSILVLINLNSLTLFGIGYFIGEIFIILFLVRAEIRIIKTQGLTA